MAENNGWIKLHRSLSEHDIWTKEVFTDGQAWVDLLILANHKPGNVKVRGIWVDVKRGQVAWSHESLAKRWKWSRGKVERFLKFLCRENMLEMEQQKTCVLSLNTIINYDSYQGSNTTNDATDGRQTEQQTDTNKNDKNEKKIKNNIGGTKFQPPTLPEILHHFIEKQFPAVQAQQFFDYYTSNGWRVGKNPMKDWKAAASGWVSRSRDFGKGKQVGPKTLPTFDDVPEFEQTFKDSK